MLITGAIFLLVRTLHAHEWGPLYERHTHCYCLHRHLNLSPPPPSSLSLSNSSLLFLSLSLPLKIFTFMFLFASPKIQLTFQFSHHLPSPRFCCKILIYVAALRGSTNFSLKLHALLFLGYGVVGFVL